MTQTQPSPSMAARIGRWALRILAAIVLLGTLASTTDADQWWIRVWDFPRLQIFIAMLVLAIALWAFDRRTRPWFAVALAVAAAWQFYRMLPYTPLAAKEVAKIAATDSQDRRCFSIMLFNVLQKNRDYAATLAMLEREDPDILLLLETDAGWEQAMGPILAKYPHGARRVLDNTYGLIFASKFPLNNTSVQDLVEPDTPSVFTTFDLSGQPVRLYGIHPRPPHPGQDTEERDAELVLVGKRAKEQGRPAIVLGDFNDVAWSDTSRLFQRVGGLLDPRIGRGTFATFPAKRTWLGWPLDYLFVSEDFLLSEMKVLENVGSDHRPMIANLCLDEDTASRVNKEAEEADADDQEEAQEILADEREDQAEDQVSGE